MQPGIAVGHVMRRASPQTVAATLLWPRKFGVYKDARFGNSPRGQFEGVCFEDNASKFYVRNSLGPDAQRPYQ